MARPWRFCHQAPKPRSICVSPADSAITASLLPADFRPRASSRQAGFVPRERGVDVHGQLFEPADAPARRGSLPSSTSRRGPRQMLLGGTTAENAHDYGANQYSRAAASVLSVDYRLSVGCSQAFQFAESARARARPGRDILRPAATSARKRGPWPHRCGILRRLPDAARRRRNSVYSRTSVDIHGVHGQLPAVNAMQRSARDRGRRHQRNQSSSSVEGRVRSSPIAAVPT